MNKLNVIDWIAIILVIIGGLNWGLVGVMDLDLVKLIFGDNTILARSVYSLVGLSSIYLLLITPRLAKN